MIRTVSKTYPIQNVPLSTAERSGAVLFRSRNCLESSVPGVNRSPIRYTFCDAPFHYPAQCEHSFRYMSKQKSYVSLKHDWLAAGVCQATAVAQFHVHVMQVSISSKTIPRGQKPGTRLEGSKSPPPETIIVYHLILILFVSLSSLVLNFPTCSVLHLLLANTGMSVLTKTYEENWFWGEESLTVSPSESKSRSFHAINSGLQRKS